MLIHVNSPNSNSRLQEVHSSDVQPNAVDIRLGRVWMMHGSFRLSEDEKIHRQKIEIFPDDQGYFEFKVGEAYEVAFDNLITMAEDEAGFVIVRSTLNRNGVFITSGLYDSGYKGSLAGCMHIRGNGPTFIRKGTRIAQFLLFKAEALHNYDGSYGFSTDGSVKKEEERYH